MKDMLTTSRTIKSNEKEEIVSIYKRFEVMLSRLKKKLLK